MVNRRLRTDLVACGFLFAGLLVTLGILTYDPADPTQNTIHPPNSSVANLLGPPGAWLASTLLGTLGVGIYVLLIAWLVLVVLLFVRRTILLWTLRAAGWLLLIPCVSVWADYLLPDSLARSVSGSGGTAGAWLRSWLETTFYPA